MTRGYGFLYKDFQIDKGGLFYNGNPANLKYCLNEEQARKWYEERKNKFVTVQIKRPPNELVDVSIPLETKPIKKSEVDTIFLDYITKGHVSTRMEFVLNKFMDDYYLGEDKCFYRRDKNDELAWSGKNTMALIMMKDIILGKFRISPFLLPEQKRSTGTAVSTKYIPWNYGSDFNIDYYVQGEKYSTNLFGVYTPKLYNIMLPNSDFEGRKLQKWQMEVQLNSGRINYIIGPRSGGKCKGELEFVRLADGTFKQAKDIKVGDKLLSSDKRGYTNVVDVDYFQKECVRVTLKDGTDFVVSKDHRIPTQSTYHNGKRDMDIDNYTTAGNLIPDRDFVPLMIDNKGFSSEKPLDFEKGVLIGMLLGDGCLTGLTPEITCTNPEKRDYIYNILDKLGYEYYLGKDKRDIGIKGLSDFRKEYGLYGDSRTKEIANTIFRESNEFKWGVINGMIWTDGYLGIKKAGSSDRNKKDSPYVEFTSVNKKMARQLRILMADVGLISYERKKQKETHFKDGREYITDFYYVYVSDKESLTKFNNHCDLSLKQNYEVWNKLIKDGAGDSHLQGNISVIPKCAFKEKTAKSVRLSGHNYYNGIREPHYDFQRWKCVNYGIEHWLKYNWNRVGKIEDIGIQNVVHIEVDGDHTYWGELDLTHNSLIMTGESAAYLLKETTSEAERLQEFAVLYMGLSVKQNAPYINYSKQMLNNLFKDGVSIVRREDDVLYLLDGDKKRSLEFITTGQADPARSRRTMFAVGDEADYLDWNKVKTLIGTPGSIVNLISTIDPKTQAGEFYKGWKKAYERQRNYEPIDVLIHRIWTDHKMHLCKSREDIEKKIKNGEMAEMRSEFLQARPEVAMHFTIDDLEFLTDAERDAQNEAAMKMGGYEYMLAENYGEYATNDAVFNTDGLQGKAPYTANYAVLGYDEAENYDDPALAVVMTDGKEYWCSQAEKLPKDPGERFARMRAVAEEYKGRCKNVYIAADISRSEAIAREMAMLGLPVDMQIRWGGNSDYKPERGRWLVNKQWCIDMINEIYITSSNFHFDPSCYEEGGLIEQISHFKRRGKKKVQAEGSGHDDQVSAMMASLFYIYNREQLGIKSKMQGQRIISPAEQREMAWVAKYQKDRSPEEQRQDSLLNLKQGLF